MKNILNKNFIILSTIITSCSIPSTNYAISSKEGIPFGIVCALVGGATSKIFFSPPSPETVRARSRAEAEKAERELAQRTQQRALAEKQKIEQTKNTLDRLSNIYREELTVFLNQKTLLNITNKKYGSYQYKHKKYLNAIEKHYTEIINIPSAYHNKLSEYDKRKLDTLKNLLHKIRNNYNLLFSHEIKQEREHEEVYEHRRALQKLEIANKTKEHEVRTQQLHNEHLSNNTLQRLRNIILGIEDTLKKLLKRTDKIEENVSHTKQEVMTLKQMLINHRNESNTAFAILKSKREKHTEPQPKKPIAKPSAPPAVHEKEDAEQPGLYPRLPAHNPAYQGER